ncbi:MAG: Gfo/Idh/MocA family oxidoreductase [Rhizobium pusense]|nr:Gfo/Idh/MocA family oxidoreductase [Agrobacterium pusense]
MIGGGLGGLIGRGHRYAMRLDDSFDLVAGAFSSTAERSKASAEALGIPGSRAYADWREMLACESRLPENERIDVVAIVTPNYLHCEQALASLQSGFHVICDKPLGVNLEEVTKVGAVARESGKVFVLTHNYSGYPLVRHARQMVRDGEIGDIRVVQVEYVQDWLCEAIEGQGHKQAAWRQDPKQAGPGGALGDIGTHAYQLATFITGLRAETLYADLSSFVGGRALDDNANVLLRYPSGAKGILWASQVAPGNENALRIRIFGSKGGITWAQEDPNRLEFTPLGQPTRTVTRSSQAVGADGAYATRVPTGHPEGWIEGFAQIYSDAAELIMARLENRDPDPRAGHLPTAEDGEDGMRFVLAAVQSHTQDRWIRLEDIAS